jgi:hypothetical protein
VSEVDGSLDFSREEGPFSREDCPFSREGSIFPNARGGSLRVGKNIDALRMGVLVGFASRTSVCDVPGTWAGRVHPCKCVRLFQE